MDLMQLLLLGISLLVLWLWSNWRQHGLRLLPSPRAFPLIGHLHLIGRLPHHSLQMLSKKYGPIMLLRFFTIPTVIISSPTIAKEVLKTNDLVCASRPYHIIGEYILYNFKDIAFAPYGEHWRNMRKLCMIELFTTKRMESFLWVKIDELKIMISHLLKAYERDEVFIVRRFLWGFAGNVISRILMGKRLFGQDGEDVDEKSQEFTRSLQDIVDSFGGFNFIEYIPSSLRWIDWKVGHAKKLHHKIDQFVQEIVDEHKICKQNGKDFIDILLSYYEKEGCNHDDIIKAITVELIQAGSDTSVTTIEWALAELLNNPHVLSKAQNELDLVVGHNRMVQVSDLSKLEYLQAIIKETFRLHPPVAVLLPHMSMQVCNIAGYVIPKGTPMLINIFAIGRDTSLWENATQFMPERFLGKAMDVRGQDFELIPFGSGRRACPGMPLALETVQLALSNLLHGFNWSLPPNLNDHPMEELFSMVSSMATPLQSKIVPRLPLEIYGSFIN